MKRYILFFIFSALSQLSFSQDSIGKKKQYMQVSLDLGGGTVMPTTDFVNGLNLKQLPIKNYQSYALRMLWQNPGYTH